MATIYTETARQLKAISDPKRLRIVDMLSAGELCACEILERFEICQSTLSHDMKLLTEAGLVNSRREGKNIYYTLNSPRLQSLMAQLALVFSAEGSSWQDRTCVCGEHREDEARSRADDFPPGGRVKTNG